LALIQRISRFHAWLSTALKVALDGKHSGLSVRGHGEVLRSAIS
jgi:hypothetical protein